MCNNIDGDRLCSSSMFRTEKTVKRFVISTFVGLFKNPTKFLWCIFQDVVTVIRFRPFPRGQAQSPKGWRFDLGKFESGKYPSVHRFLRSRGQRWSLLPELVLEHDAEKANQKMIFEQDVC